MTPLSATYALWAAWALSWGLAAGWSKAAAARPAVKDELAYRAAVAIGYLLVFTSARRAALGLPIDSPLWRLGGAAGWALFAFAGAGFAASWWARLALGPLWSGSVTRKEDHRIVETGPYRWVRHPIYTGLLAATFATVVEMATPMAIAGFGVVVVGMWLKARLEERFLSQELGPEAYRDYQRRTPMLAPFWPGRR